MARRRSGPRIVHFTRAAILRPIVDHLDELGCRTWTHLASAHISPDVLEDPDALVPVRAVRDFADAVRAAEGFDALGLRVARSMTLADLGVFGTALLSSRNVFRYLARGCRFLPTVTTNERFWLEFGETELRFCHADLDDDRPLDAYLLTLGLTIDTIRAAADRRWIPSEITLPVPPPRNLARIADTFANVRLDARRSYASFTIPIAFLTRPMPGARREAAGKDDFDAIAPPPTEFEESVRRLAEVLVLDGAADLPTAAEASGMSARTLQRRLFECGADFSRLVLDARIGLSERWLRETDRPITDIAHSLGYSDSANFTRAFRRVNGITPQVYRRVSKDAPEPLEAIPAR